MLVFVLMELIGDLFLVGMINIVNGFGKEVGEVFVISKWIVKIVFMGLILVGKYILCVVVDSLILLMVELGGKSLNIFFVDVFD